MVVSDTHCHEWEDVHPEIRRAITEADIAIHCGDFVRMSVIEGMRREARRAIVVHGNSDPVDIRQAIPYVEVLEIEGRRIGITHPAWGGPEFPLEELLPDFPEPIDAIIFGHLHETIVETREGILFVNPGQGYASFMVDATIALVTVNSDGIAAKIQVIEKGR